MNDEANRRLAHVVERQAEHARNARLLADVARETGGNVKDEREKHRARRAERAKT